MRSILHVDMNAFYASVEQAENPKLRGLPVAVAGDKDKRNGIILTSSYEARAFGVKTAMTVGDAKNICPNLIFIRPNFKLYMNYSRRVMNILRSYSPDVEVFSVDEAWVDVTGCERLFGSPVEIGEKIRARIKKELGITASVGVSYCKLMAKMGSDLKKPDGLSVVMMEDIPSKIWPLPVQSLIGVGRRMRPKLNEIGIFTVGDLAATSLTVLEKRFGKMGRYLWHFANGIDDSKVTSTQEEVKGIGNSVTTPRDVVNINEASEVLFSLCESVGTRVRERGLEGNTIEITVRTKDFNSFVRQRKIDVHTDITPVIHREALRLLKANWKEDIPLRLLGVRISGLRPATGSRQISFFDEKERVKGESIDKCMDAIRKRFGYGSVIRANLMVNGADTLVKTISEDSSSFHKGGEIV